MMLRSGRVPGLTPALFLGVAALAACSDSATAPSTESAVHFPASVNKVVEGEEVCQTIDFETFAHGTTITNQISVFGNVLTFSAVGYNAAGAEIATPVRIYAGGTHQAGPDFDLQSTGAGALCATCTSNLAVIQEIGGHEGGATSDNTWGGEMTISGFPANTFYIKSYQLADHESPGEPDSRLFVNGGNVAPAGQPNGVNAVITVNTASQPLITGPIRFEFGSPPNQQGSEAIDNIEVCQRVPVLGDDGCTPGFWKNHEEAWVHTAYDTDDTVEDVFDVPDIYGLDNVTLLAVLDMGGGGSTTEVAARLLHHAVAALLNASHGLVDYPQTVAAIIAETNAALASGNKNTMNTLKDKFDTQNNAGCPINGKEPLPN